MALIMIEKQTVPAKIGEVPVAGNPVEWDGGVGIVEDKQYLIEIIAKMLEINEIPVSFIAHDGLDAVQKYLKSCPKPDVVIMNYRLQSTTGVQVMEEMMQQSDSDTAFVFMSADVNRREEALSAGASMFLEKPATMKDLIESVELAAKNK